MGNTTLVKDHIAVSARTVTVQHAVSSKPLFIPTPHQMVFQLQEWKKDVSDWEKEYLLITRLVNMTRLSEHYANVASLFNRYKDFMNQKILFLFDRIDNCESELINREAQLIPLEDISEFEELQAVVKALKKEINDFKLPVLEAVVRFYPVSIM